MAAWKQRVRQMVRVLRSLSRSPPPPPHYLPSFSRSHILEAPLSLQHAMIETLLGDCDPQVHQGLDNPDSVNKAGGQEQLSIYPVSAAGKLSYRMLSSVFRFSCSSLDDSGPDALKMWRLNYNTISLPNICCLHYLPTHQHSP